jgi:outer membrane receptor protein involved in Fe transport
MFAGNAFPHVPKNKVTGEVLIFPVEGLMLGLNAVFTDSRPFISDFSNSFDKQEEFLVVNSKLKFKRDKITVSLDINNLFDEDYSEYGVLGFNLNTFAYERAFYPSPGRNFLAGASVEF